MSLVEVRDVEKVYELGQTKVPALRGVSFSVEPGEFLSIMGPSGCGKTTLLNIIGCIDRATAGHVEIEGRNLDELSDNEQAEIRLHKFGFIFQSFNLIPVLSVFENIEFPTLLAQTPKGERREYISYLIEQVGLEEYSTHKPDELSGGQRQRVAIARALVNRPRLVIADEPTANLDSETGNRVLEVMQRLNEHDQVSFIFSTHDPEVNKHARRAIRLKDGLIVSDGLKETAGSAGATGATGATGR